MKNIAFVAWMMGVPYLLGGDNLNELTKYEHAPWIMLGFYILVSCLLYEKHE